MLIQENVLLGKITVTVHSYLCFQVLCWHCVPMEVWRKVCVGPLMDGWRWWAQVHPYWMRIPDPEREVSACTPLETWGDN